MTTDQTLGTPDFVDTLGFVGYGAMASRMGKRLSDAGYGILAYAPHHQPDDASVRFLGSAEAVAAEVGTILVSVPDDAALDQASTGILGGARPSSLLINLSSVSPAASIKLAGAGEARGLSVLDAPVSGSTPEAASGTLVVLVGGHAADFERARPILSIIGSKAVHVGPAGAGSTMKLVINGIMGAGLTALAEALGYGLAAGLDRNVLFDTLDGLAVISPHHQRKLQSAREGDFAAQFPTALMHKDLGLLLAETTRAGMPVPTLAASAQTLALSRPQHDHDDYSALIGVMQRLAARRQ